MSVCPSGTVQAPSHMQPSALDRFRTGNGLRVGEGSGFLGVHGLLLLMTLLVAGSFPVAEAMMESIKLAGLRVSGSELMLLRFVLAAVLFAPYVFIVFGWRLPSIGQLCVYGALAIPLVVFFSCMFTSLTMTTALNTGALFTTVPTFTALMAWWLNGETSNGRRVVGLLLGTMGALWVVLRGDLAALLNWGFNPGDGLFLIGCVFLALYQPLVKRWALNVPVAVMTFWVIVMAAVWLILSVMVTSWISPFAGGENGGGYGGVSITVLWGLPRSVYWGLLYLSLFTTLLSFFVQQLGALTVGPSRTSAYSLLTPSVVMVISVWIDPSLFNWVLIPGVAMVIVGLLFLQIEGRGHG